ncbi:Carbamoyl-phosphate synthase large chain [Buchnera aphidicola (Periphyllus testudinaceus)]|uniref:carbamoyl-phosphate synthase large subunit n=1 Tax=Buchnera aphidicola TaxID=9 RepID=UPI003463BC14
MPKINTIKSILVLGAGPIIIGQACEFDYSGAQACKALKEEGYKVILINSNPATIMTDPKIAHKTYVEPIHWKIVKKIIKKEKPDALLPTMGGQTALNCALKLHKKNILSKFKVKMIGATVSSIKKAENRSLFRKSMKKIHIKMPKSGIAHSLKEAFKIAKKIGFPCIIRPSFTMGGTGGGIAYNIKEFKKICEKGLILSPTKELLIDESMIGWKEYEMEVIRDKNNNCIIVCSIENIDPMGIHTGDSITVSPAQTLSDKEYQIMRNSSIKILEEIGIETGGSNVQFAINPKNGDIVVIEMNPRVSRSSALASKATGFPIAKIAAKLSIGYTLDELNNTISGINIPASFEPSIDYVVTKIPRFNFDKFPSSNKKLTTQMKSVGEVMAIGRTFQESLQKAIRSLEINSFGFDLKNFKNKSIKNIKKIKKELKYPGSDRLWYIGEAFRNNISIKKIHKITQIDMWFLIQIQELILIEEKIKKNTNIINKSKFLKKIKQKGFSDKRIANLINKKENYIRKLRYKKNIHPVYKRVDSCSAEFKTSISYMYSTWEDECESKPTKNINKIIILGSGPNRIGQGIEFDYCCVHAAQALKKNKFETIIINCNPETVSTDYDTSDKLYFEPINLENVLEIIRIEKPKGVIIQFGGQTPLKLAKKLYKEGIKIIGTSAKSIDKSEDRKKFQKIIKKLKLKQPKNKTVKNLLEAKEAIKKIKYPIMIRPSYVLGGQSMEILYNSKSLKKYFKNKIKNKKEPIFIDHYLENAKEIDVDAVFDGEQIFIGGIIEHIEPAGIHSGDSACSLPSYSLNKKIISKIKKQVKKISLELKIKGLINIQFALKNNKLYIIEVNPRAARTIPFISKSTGIQLAKVATKVMIGINLKKQNFVKEEIKLKYYSVKESVFPFNKFSHSDPILGPEMKSTGEVMGIGKSFEEAFGKAILGTQNKISNKKRTLLIINEEKKKLIIKLAKKLKKFNFKIDTTKKIYDLLKKNNIHTRNIQKIYDNKLKICKKIKNGKYSYIISTAISKNEIKTTKFIREQAIQYKIYYNTTINGAIASINSLKKDPFKKILYLQKIHKKIKIK